MNATMLSFWGCESNPNANPATTSNGGGILVWLENGEYITVSTEDLSCGDFGTRIGWSMESTDGRKWGGCFGTMDDAMVDNEWSEDSLSSVSGVYGVDARAMLQDALAAASVAAAMVE